MLYVWFDSKSLKFLISALPDLINSFVFASYKEIDVIFPTSPVLATLNEIDVLFTFTSEILNAPNVVNVLVSNQSEWVSLPSTKS